VAHRRKKVSKPKIHPAGKVIIGIIAFAIGIAITAVVGANVRAVLVKNLPWKV